MSDWTGFSVNLEKWVYDLIRLISDANRLHYFLIHFVWKALNIIVIFTILIRTRHLLGVVITPQNR